MYTDWLPEWVKVCPGSGFKYQHSPSPFINITGFFSCLTDLWVMLEGTYIPFGTWGILLHTWHASHRRPLVSHSGLRVRGGQRDQAASVSTPCGPGGMKHMSIVSMKKWLGFSLLLRPLQFLPPSFSSRWSEQPPHQLSVSIRPTTAWTAPWEQRLKETAEGRQ